MDVVKEKKLAYVAIKLDGESKRHASIARVRETKGGYTLQVLGESSQNYSSYSIDSIESLENEKLKNDITDAIKRVQRN